MALGDHLCAYQNIDVPFPESAQHAIEVAKVLHGVAVDAANAGIAEQFLQVGLDTLGSLADVVNVLALAVGADLRRPLLLAAVVAKQPADAPVIGHRNAARCALKGEA